MYVIKKMRLNKFQPRPIVSNRELFVSNGQHPATIQSKDTPECYKEPSILGASKTKLLGLAHDIGTAAIAHHKGENNSKLNKDQDDL